MYSDADLHNLGYKFKYPSIYIVFDDTLKDLYDRLKVKCLKHENYFDISVRQYTKPEKTMGCIFCKRESLIDSKLKNALEKYSHRFICKSVEQVEITNSKQVNPICHFECKLHGTKFSQRLDAFRHKPKCEQCNPPPKSGRLTLGKDILKILYEKMGPNYIYTISPTGLYSTDRTTHMVYCKVHDSFLNMNLRNSIRGGTGCLECRRELASEKASLRLDDFLSRVSELDLTHYDYSEVTQGNFKSGHSVIPIRCTKHDYKFHQQARYHLRGSAGCKYCQHEAMGRTNYNLYNKFAPITQEQGNLTLYKVKITNLHSSNEFIKIGLTYRENPEGRFENAGLKSRNFEVETLDKIWLNNLDAMYYEECLLDSLENMNKRYRIHDLKVAGSSGWTECFRFEEEEFIDFVFSEIRDLLDRKQAS